MNKGQKVKIYQKPITKENLEGEAILIEKCLSNEINNTEIWQVKFPGENETTVIRTILIKK